MADDGNPIDPAVRDRVMELIDPFVDALDEAVANPTPDALDDLQESADELMRAIGRVMIELGKSNKAP